MQNVDPLLDCLKPSGQCLQLVDPNLSLKRPGAQCTQLSAPSTYSLTRPGEQSSQYLALPETLDLPSGQTKQSISSSCTTALRRSSEMNVFAGQALHAISSKSSVLEMAGAVASS